MKVLVTGATGFVGKALIGELRERRAEIISVAGPNNANADHAVDVGDRAQVQRLAIAGGIDAIVHLAGLAHRFGRTSDDEFRRVNIDGVENIAELGARLGAKHFLLFSSTLVYGRPRNTGPITETEQCDPIDPYGMSKLEGETAACRVCESAGIALTIFRPAPIMGEGSKGNFSRLIAAIDRRRFIWVGKGTNLKSVVYVGDVARAAAEVLATGGRGTQTFNITADPVRMSEIVDAIADKLGRKVPPVHLPASAVRIAASAASVAGGKFKRMRAMLDTWLGDDVYANNRLRGAYGYTPSTPLDEAVGREVEYYLKHK
jgi:nucleoside-diphosphate-sugar epimerase